MQANGLRLKTDQTTTLSPKQIQSISILQMDMAQLERFLVQQLEENPLIDLEAELEEPCVWAASEVERHFFGAQHREEGLTALDFAAAPDESATLSAFIRDQLNRRQLPEKQLRLCLYIAEFLDERGYLPLEDIELLYTSLTIPIQEIDQAVKTLKSLEPAGIAARDMQECLLIQLDRLEGECSTAKEIVRWHLPDLAQKRFSSLAKKLGLPLQEIYHAAAQIRRLEPMPGNAYIPPQAVQYIRPDVYVVRTGVQLKVIVNDTEIRGLGLNRYYMELEQETQDTELTDYLREKIAQAKWLFSCLRQRCTTLELCVCNIVEIQRSFFLEGKGGLLPLTLADIARQTGLHESTVCRALQGKYLMCEAGTFPLSYFFSNAVSGDGESTSAASVKNALAALIKDEDKTAPLSDQQLQALLEQKQGIHISRRTVAKYRNALRIPTASERRSI